MACEFRFLDDVALADSAFEARGNSPSELFKASAQAVIETMVDPSTVKVNWNREVTLVQSQVSDLLFEWLCTLVFLKDAEAVLFHDVQAEVWMDSHDQTWHVCGTLFGDAIDPSKQELRADVKAVTKHLFEVKQTDNAWVARVVLDV